MAAAPSVAGSKSNTVSVKERRWVVLGICLNKVLTPALRDVLADEIQKWYQVLLQPPDEIDKQTFVKHHKKLPPFTLKLNYGSINNNTVHKSPRNYDYAVKDSLSLAKLFMKPYMANFTGFDQTMDTSAVLSVLCEAQPFIASGAAGIAKKVRADIRNEWAHCNFSHWTEPNFQAAWQSMESLIKKVNLIPVERKKLLDDLEGWKNKGLQLCFGQVVDAALLKLIESEVVGLKESVKLWKEDKKCEQKLILSSLASIKTGLKQEVEILKEKQALTENKVQELDNYYTSSCRDIEILQNKLSKVILQSDEDIAYVFRAPQPNPWFSGRGCQIQELKSLLRGKEERANGQKKVSLAAVCGLGGIGKTSLVVEYAQRMRDHYLGGVFWFSGEDDMKLENSVNEVAMNIGTFLQDSFDDTLSKTLVRISRIRKPWLIVIDDMDELHLSQNVTKIISGSWQHGVTGHVVITTRRKPSAVTNDIRGFQESCCIQMECLDPKEAKIFLFNRTGIQCNEETGPVADSLVAELGGLPLALEQACAFIKCLGCSLPSYLESYKAQSLHLLHRQSVTRVSEYESPERLAVKTTWYLNFGHIKQSIGGKNAIRFLNACAFFSPNVIQQELINVGEPFVEDEQFREFVGVPLGCQQVLKMLTDFSLFKESEKGCLSVHRLVQEVILENLNSDEKAESFVDAVRFLRFAFLKCPSPDEFLTSMADEKQQRVSVDSTDPSRFCQWSKLCLHGYEIRKNVDRFEKQSASSSGKTTIFLETARIVYECALHLSVHCRHEEAKQMVNFTYRILDWAALGDHEVSKEKLQALFPHILPLPELVRRHILYSCKDISGVPKAAYNTSSDISLDFNKSELNKRRLEGNRLFRESLFDEAIEEYSSAMNMSKGTTLFDARLLSNRASAYLKIKQYDNALKDAEDYIEQCPDCWKGYARKALALKGFNKELDAMCAAALAFYRKKTIFREYLPFTMAFSGLEACIYVCDSSFQLLAACSLNFPPWFTVMPNEIKTIILIEPGEYVISSLDLKICTTHVAIVHEPPTLLVSNCILLGNGSRSFNSRVCLNFKGDCCLDLEGISTVSDIDFIFDQGFCFTALSVHSIVKLFRCFFTNDNKTFPVCQFEAGKLDIDYCSFKNCKAGGLLVAKSGVVEVRNSICSGNGQAGLEVREGGDLFIRDCDSYANKQGVLIGPCALKCTLINSQIHDNKVEGIMVNGKSSGVVLSDNRIFHNDQYGISIVESRAIIERNTVFDNCLWGIWIQSNSLCQISHNNVYRNKVGGIRIGMRQCREGEETVVEFNKIYDNRGPGIDEKVEPFEVFSMRNCEPAAFGPLGITTGRIPDLKKAKRRENELINNKELSGKKSVVSSSSVKLCSYCHKESDLKKCTECFTAEYCGRNCQKKHWKTHRNICSFYVEQCSSVIYLSTKPGDRTAKCTIAVNFHHPDLEPVGPAYGNRPTKNGPRCIVKVQSFGRPFQLNVYDLLVYDRSFTIYGYCESSVIGHLVREHGEICERKYIEKKLFLWALYCEDGKIRIFTNEFAPSQRW